MNKHLMLSHLQTILPPIKHLIDKKAEAVDWNENDSDAKGFIRNRPFYSYITQKVLIDNVTITIEDGYGELAMEGITLNVGQKYTVIFNGETYECVARHWPDADAVLLGNGTIYGDGDSSNGEPFSCDNYNDGSIFLNVLVDGDYTVSISSIIPEIKKIDPKFLPEQVELGQGDMIGKAGGADGAEIFNNYDLNKATSNYSHAEGFSTTASGMVSHAEGHSTTASGSVSHAEGNSTTAVSPNQHVQGKYNMIDSSSTYAHIVGNGTSNTSRSNAHALDWNGNAYFAGDVYVNGDGADNFANNKKLATEEFVTNQISTVPNNSNILNGEATGSLRTIGADEETDTYKLGRYSFAQGDSTFAKGYAAHAEGRHSTASGAYSHAEGFAAHANGSFSHAEGEYVEANSEHQHVQGKYNIIDSAEVYAHIVGNGTPEGSRSNAHTLDWNGNAWYQGDVFVGGTDQDSGERLAKMSDLDSISVASITTDEINTICGVTV